MEGRFSSFSFSIDQIIKILKNKISKNGSVILIGSISNKTIIHDQELSYHLTKSSLEQMTKFYAVRLGKKKLDLIVFYLQK